MFNAHKTDSRNQTFDGLLDRSAKMKWRLIRSLDYGSRSGRGNKPNGLRDRIFELQCNNPGHATFGTIHGGTSRYGWYAEWCYYGEKYPDWERYPNLKMWWFEEPPYDADGNPLRPQRVWETVWIPEGSYDVQPPTSTWKGWPLGICTIHDFQSPLEFLPRYAMHDGTPYRQASRNESAWFLGLTREQAYKASKVG